MSSDDGIAFYNRQQLTSVTPVWDFQNRIESDPQGRRAAKLYQFSATTYDWAELTITTVLRGSGLQIWPSYTHTIDAAISSVPTEGHGLGRAIAGMIGMDEDAINQRVYEGAIGEFRQQIPQEALEEATERIAVEAAQRNADLRSKGLVGDNTLAVRDIPGQGPVSAVATGVCAGRRTPGHEGCPRPAWCRCAGPCVASERRHRHSGYRPCRLAAGKLCGGHVRARPGPLG